MITWSDVTLCTDADIVGFESSWLSWTNDPDGWRAKAKEQIAKELRFMLRERELGTDADEVLDLIGNPEVLQDAASYKALALCARNNMTGPDAWEKKADYYDGKFDAELAKQVEMLEFDEDESGTIEESEKYRISGAIRFTRGG